MSDAVNSFKEKIPNFLAHVFIKWKQSSCFQKKLSNIPKGTAIVQVDFSENYSFQQQGEIQSAYWSQKQLTIFTVCIWAHDAKKRMVFVSDNLDHDKTSVLVFIHKLLVELISEKAIKKADIFSDGPSSQFKNQYVLNFLPVLRDLNHIESLNWHFFATSHGKGAVDGIGGTVKRNVWMETRSRKPVVNSEDFCKVAIMKEQHVKLSQCQLKGIKKMYFVTALDHSKIHCKEYSCKPRKDNASEQHMEIERSDSDLGEWYDDRWQQLCQAIHINVEDFVMCRYEGEFFVGKVTAVHPEGKGAQIKVFEKCAGGWR